MFKIISHILHFLGIGCFYIAKVKVINNIYDKTAIVHIIEGYSFTKNPYKNLEKMFENIPSILIIEMLVTKIW